MSLAASVYSINSYALGPVEHNIHTEFIFM